MKAKKKRATPRKRRNAYPPELLALSTDELLALCPKELLAISSIVYAVVFMKPKTSAGTVHWSTTPFQAIQTGDWIFGRSFSPPEPADRWYVVERKEHQIAKSPEAGGKVVHMMWVRLRQS